MTRRARDLIVVVVATLLVVVAPLAGGAGRAGAQHPLAFFGRAVVQTLLTPFRKGAKYESIEAQRDADLAAIGVTMNLRQWQHDKGWIDDATLAGQQQAFAALQKAVTARAEREKKMNRAAYNRALGNEWKTAAENALIGLATANLRSGDFFARIIKGDDPLQAGLDKILATPVRTYDDLAAAQAELNKARQAVAFLRDPSGALEASFGDLENLLAANVPGNLGNELAPEFLKHYQDKARVVMERLGSLLQKIDRLTGTRVKVDGARLLRDPEWAALTTAIMQAGSIPLSNRMLLASMTPQVQARLDQLVEGRSITEEQRRSVVLDVLAWYLSVQQQRVARMPNLPTFDLDAAINAALDRFAPVPTTSTSHDEAAERAAEEAARRPSRSARPGEQLEIVMAPPAVMGPNGQLLFYGTNASASSQVNGSSGSLVVDFDSRSVTGTVSVTYDCGEGNCTTPGMFSQGEATITFAGTASPAQTSLWIWDLAGTVQVSAHAKADHCGAEYPCPLDTPMAGAGTFEAKVAKETASVRIDADHLAEAPGWLVSYELMKDITEDVPGP